MQNNLYGVCNVSSVKKSKSAKLAEWCWNLERERQIEGSFEFQNVIISPLHLTWEGSVTAGKHNSTSNPFNTHTRGYRKHTMLTRSWYWIRNRGWAAVSGLHNSFNFNRNCDVDMCNTQIAMCLSSLSSHPRFHAAACFRHKPSPAPCHSSRHSWLLDSVTQLESACFCLLLRVNPRFLY